ncbi:MAG: hypothetical protein JNM47_06870 [Hyphomonadaceae bacterium]|nr:hypothetical protein [Hyphomonadaceae bacterium]
MNYCILMVAVLGLGACAMNSGATSIGPDKFVISRQAATGFSGMGTLKPQALAEANDKCSQSRRVAYVTRTQESKPPYIFGNFPRVEIEFVCVAPDDPRLAAGAD